MKNVKLAFSVYALALALASNGAWAVIGTSRPTCDSNPFNISYRSSKSFCTDGYWTLSNQDRVTYSPEQTAYWDTQFTPYTTDSADIKDKMYCLGYDLNGWQAASETENTLKSGVNLSSASGTANSNSLWTKVANAAGNTVYEVEAKWKAEQQNLILEQTPENTTKLVRKGIKLYSDANASAPATSVIKPVKAGYEFRGYYLNDQAATTVGSCWKSNTVAFCSPERCDNQAAWTEILNQTTTGGKNPLNNVVGKCPIVKADGTVSTFAGTGIAAYSKSNGINDDIALYPAFEPQEFYVDFKLNLRDSQGNACTGSEGDYNCPLHTDVTLPDGWLSSQVAKTVTCRYGIKDSCTYQHYNSQSTPETKPLTSLYYFRMADSKGIYEFDGFKGSVKIGTQEYTFTIPENQVNAYSDLQNIFKDYITQIVEDNKNVVPDLTLYVQWKKKSVALKFYDSTTAQTPVVTYQVVRYTDGNGTEVVKYYDENEQEVSSVDVSKFTAPDGYMMRGFVTAETTSYVPEKIDEDSGEIGNTNVGYMAELCLFANKTGAIKTSVKECLTSDSKVYPIWAQKCEPANDKVATCGIHIDDNAQVWYINTCDSGYHIKDTTVDKINNGKTNQQ